MEAMKNRYTLLAFAIEMVVFYSLGYFASVICIFYLSWKTIVINAVRK